MVRPVGSAKRSRAGQRRALAVELLITAALARQTPESLEHTGEGRGEPGQGGEDAR